MNWKKIKEKYPWAYDRFIEYHLKKTVFIEWLHEGDLYDFFDEQKIHVDVTYTTNGWEEPPWFYGCVYTVPVIITESYPSRRKAEAAVFKKAFKVLEKKLK